MQQQNTLRISVVVPLFNSATYLRDALDSALNQRPPPFEVIVQDGGSSDGSVEILREFGNAVSWESARDRGQADALNKAVARSSGDVIVWLNADDLLKPGAFAAAAETLRSEPAADFVYGDFEMIRGDGSVFRRYKSSTYDPERVFTHGCYIFSGAIFYRRALLDRIGPFDVDLQTCMDFEYLLRLRDARHEHVGTSVAQFRLWGEGKSSTMRSRFLREALAIRLRFARSSRRLQLLAWAIAAWELVSLYTHPLRTTRAWSAVRPGKRL